MSRFDTARIGSGVLAKPERRAPRQRKRVARGKPPVRHVRVKQQRETERARQQRRDTAYWSKAVKTRSGGRCELEGGRVGLCSGQIESHHHYRKGPFPRLRFDLDNGIALCKAHHDWADTPVGRRWIPVWLANRDPERWARLQRKAQRESWPLA